MVPPTQNSRVRVTFITYYHKGAHFFLTYLSDKGSMAPWGQKCQCIGGALWHNCKP